MADSNALTPGQIEDLEADLAYHERMAATIRKRLAKHAGAGCADDDPDMGEHFDHAQAVLAQRDAEQRRAGARNLVAEQDACPGCGERDADRLEWLNDEDGQVRCEGCGFVYIPGK